MGVLRILSGIAAVAALGILFLGATRTGVDMPAGRTNQVEGVATSTPPAASDEPLTIFGSIPYWDQDRAVADFKAHTDAYDIISLFWYRLDESGGIVKYDYADEDLSILSYAREHGVKTLALIANLPENDDWDSESVERVIGSDAARAAHIAEILALVEQKGFDGVNIDYEMLDDGQTEDFSRFIGELADALHADGKILAVAVHAQFPGSETRGQDLRALQAADIIAFMTYDEHWETSEPGPVASLPWVQEVISHALSLGLDRKKIYMGLPLYGYDWPEGGNADGREYEDVRRIANSGDAQVRFDAFAASPVVTYTDDGASRELWFENAESFRAKYELARQYGLGGVHLWRLGRQDMRMYDVLQEGE